MWICYAIPLWPSVLSVLFAVPVWCFFFVLLLDHQRPSYSLDEENVFFFFLYAPLFHVQQATINMIGHHLEPQGHQAQKADPVRGTCGTHGEHETAKVCDARRTDRGRGLRGRQEK